MAREYPQEVYDQQAKVKREIRKLNRMRAEHLIATGQLPTKFDIPDPPPGFVVKDSASNGQQKKPASPATSPRPSSSH